MMTKLEPVLFETVRLMRGRVPLWPLHRDRVEASATALGLTVPTVSPTWGGDDQVVRCELHPEGWQLVPREVPASDPVALATSPGVHRGYPHKTTDRAWLEAARLSVTPLRADDALLLNDDGQVVEASCWAIGWWEGEELVFPPLSLGGLPSVARAHLTTLVRGGVRTGTLRREELSGRSLVACNAARGVVPVAALDGEAVPGNLRTAPLARRFWEKAPA